MSINSTFAANLRLACLKHGSISAVCRGTKINRQQFNKYLSGRILPNKSTMSKLCQFLGVETDALYQTRVSGHVGSSKTPQTVSSKSVHGMEIQNHPTRTKTSESALADGLYVFVSPMTGTKELFLRSIIKIRSNSGGRTFNRITIVRSPSKPKLNIVYSKHRGSIYNDSEASYLCGRNLFYPHELSFLAVNTSQRITGSTYTGIAFIHASHGPFACRFALVQVDWKKENLRKQLGQVGIVRRNDPSVDASTWAALNLQPTQMSMAWNIGLTGLEMVATP